MVDILKQVGTADWDMNMSVNTPASWYVHGMRTRLGMPSGLTALQGLTRLNVLVSVSHGEGEPTVLGSGPRRWHCVVLKAGKESI